MYDDYNDVELVTKDIEDINQEITLTMKEQQKFLEEFKELKKNFIASKSTSHIDSEEYYDETNSLTEAEKLELIVNDPISNY